MVFFNLLFYEQCFAVSRSGSTGWARRAWAASWQLADLSCDRAAGSLRVLAGGRSCRKPQSHCPALALALGCRQCHGYVVGLLTARSVHRADPDG